MTDDLPMKAIAENVQRLRKGQSLSLATLAKKSGVGKSTIFNLERAQGNPVGGVIAQEYALAHPANLRSLVLANTFAAADPFGLPARPSRAGPRWRRPRACR
jgi:transcriptional regulator with XRE-family HTH domain